MPGWVSASSPILSTSAKGILAVVPWRAPLGGTYAIPAQDDDQENSQIFSKRMTVIALPFARWMVPRRRMASTDIGHRQAGSNAWMEVETDCCRWRLGSCSTLPFHSLWSSSSVEFKIILLINTGIEEDLEYTLCGHQRKPGYQTPHS